ncbi:MAG: uracil phosphoribosyltransferase [Haloferacaceae archaeon]
MPTEDRGDAHVVTHPLARAALTRLRDADTDPAAFREELVEVGRICGTELVATLFETEPVSVETPLTETTGVRVAGLDDVVLINVLRAATPLVEGLLAAFPAAKQGVISASRDEEAGMDPDGSFPVGIEYVKLPDIGPEDTVVVADPMLATGSTLRAVLDHVVAAGASPDRTVVLSAVAAPEGLDRLADSYPEVRRVTVAIDDGLDDDGFIVPGLGDAGDRAFNTS